MGYFLCLKHGFLCGFHVKKQSGFQICEKANRSFTRLMTTWHRSIPLIA